MSEDWLEEAKEFFAGRDVTLPNYKSILYLETIKPLIPRGGAKQETKANLLKRFARVEKNINSWKDLKGLLQDDNLVIKDNYSAESNDNELRCIFWNCGGLISKLEKTTFFLNYVIQKRPDMIFLNELKCLEEKFDNDETTVENLARLLDYECIYVPSNSENGPSKRGSAILYRKNAKEKFEYVGNPTQESNDKMEAVSGIFKFGNVEHRMICVYVAPHPNQATKAELINYLNKFKTLRVIAVGDFNIDKSNTDDRKNLQNATGFKDVLRYNLYTNYSSGTGSSIDYIMQKGINEGIKHKRFPPENSENGHAMFLFSVPRPT